MSSVTAFGRYDLWYTETVYYIAIILSVAGLSIYSSHHSQANDVGSNVEAFLDAIDSPAPKRAPASRHAKRNDAKKSESKESESKTITAANDSAH
ncbi:MAG: hypothetical protein EOP09_12500 [Proteobacteria bacterium]|nr:MAG: hypothetical protein EOP09_12500 [Pseudomonadota bacterium]